MTLKVTLEYDGTRYSGWQEQPNARTIMGVLREAIEDILRQEVELMGAGRTDAGVHATGQVAHLRLTSAAKLKNWPLDRLTGELNGRLPADIAIRDIAEAPRTFHARHDAVSRRYIYQIATRKSAFTKRHVWWIRQPLDAGAMSQGAALMRGRHDFTRFHQRDPQRPGESPIVVVSSASLQEEDDGLLLFRIEASHFLWRMVRRLAGTLVKIGLGELTLSEFEQLLANRGEKRDIASWTAPAAGLFLEYVEYPPASLQVK
jgi:tRNA pseudouridine38-40 synthase